MRYDDLPERWASKLKAYLREELGLKRDGLSATDFCYNLKVDLGDGSFVFFRYAFYLLDRDLDEIAVFTEHCGYHIFPLEGTELEVIE